MTTIMMMKRDATDRHIRNGEFFTESVPFSCCSVKALRPCITNFVHDRKRHFEYHPDKEMTIYQDSCADVTSRFMRKVVKRVGRFSVGVLFVSVSNTAVLAACTSLKR